MIQEVIADIDAEAGEIVLLIHWMGGVHTELRLPRRRRGQRNSTSPDIIAAVRQLVLIANDDLIAGMLNRNKLTTGHGNRWTRERVTSLRSHHKIPVYRPAEDGIEPWLNLTKAAAHSRRQRQDAAARRRKRRDRGPSSACRTAPGSSAEPRSTDPPPSSRRTRPAARQDTPRDHIPISKIYSLQ